jgi:hypothetical protein
MECGGPGSSRHIRAPRVSTTAAGRPWRRIAYLPLGIQGDAEAEDARDIHRGRLIDDDGGAPGPAAAAVPAATAPVPAGLPPVPPATGRVSVGPTVEGHVARPCWSLPGAAAAGGRAGAGDHRRVLGVFPAPPPLSGWPVSPGPPTLALPLSLPLSLSLSPTPLSLSLSLSLSPSPSLCASQLRNDEWFSRKAIVIKELLNRPTLYTAMMAPRCAPIPLPHPPGRRPAGGVRPTPRTARQVKVRRVGAVRRRGLRSSRPGRTFHRPPDESRGRLQSHAPTSPRLPVPAPIRVHGSPDSSDRLSAFRPCVRPDHDHHQLITITITKTHPPNPHRFVGVRCSPTGCGKGCGGGGRGGMAKKFKQPAPCHPAP